MALGMGKKGLSMTTPIEKPMLFTAENVRAILREKDPKTQTRRVVKHAQEPWKRIGDERCAGCGQLERFCECDMG